MVNVAKARLNNPLLLLLLLAGDLFFVTMFGLLGLGIISDPGFALIHDSSYAETFQYVKLFWLVMCFTLLVYVTREKLYALFAVVFLFLLADDYLQIHERAGEALADVLHLPNAFMLNSYDFGELMVFSLYGVVFLPAFALAYRASSAATRRNAATLFEFVMALAFFAVVVDLLHALHLPYALRHSIGAVEDGGEMMAVSGMFWYVYCLANQSIKAQDHTFEVRDVTKIKETKPATKESSVRADEIYSG